MLLVGSKALCQFIDDIGRVTHDWDIWMTEQEYAVFLQDTQGFKHIKSTPHCHLFERGDELVEIKTDSQFEPTDKIIFNLKYDRRVYTPLGLCFVPTMQAIYDMKAATALCIDEPKHQHDLNLLSGYNHIYPNSDLFQARLAETKARIEKSKKVKYDFFHKYHIPEYIYHDNLHVIIGDLMGLNLPTYLRITSADTDIAEDLFNKLTPEQKVSLMVEESLVLALERWFLPQMIENGINYKLIELFYNNNEGLPTYQILKHCCITGLKGEAEYITSFARANFFEIEKKWQEAKVMIKEKKGFPPEFYNKIFDLRTRYKNGEKVALT